MIKYKVTPISSSIHLENDSPVFGESSTFISLDDEAAGPFVVIRQCDDEIELGTVKLDFESLELVYKEAKKLMRGYAFE